jgi:hypothetical protein
MTDKKDEVSWIKNSLMPLLRRLGWRRVDFVHGPLEAGRDIIMADYDRFGLLKYYAGQAKDGDLRQTSESPEINTILDQLRTAFQTNYRDPLSGTEHKIAGVYLIVNGSITDAARNILYSHTGGWLSIVDRSQLELAPLIGRPLSDDERWARFVAIQLEIAKNLRILDQFLPQLENLKPQDGITLPLRPLRSNALERFLNEIGYQELDPDAQRAFRRDPRSMLPHVA